MTGQLGVIHNVSLSKERFMTAIVALKGKDHVVMAGDTLNTFGPVEGLYRRTTPKVRIINGDWIIGVADALEGLQIVRDFGEEKLSGLPDRNPVDALAERMFEAYKKKGFAAESTFLLGGVDKSRPFIRTWKFKKNQEGILGIEGSLEPDGNHYAIGACHHGAFYFLTQFQRPNTVEQDAFQVFHCVAEVAKHDVRVDRPIDLAVAHQGKAFLYCESELTEFVDRSISLTSSISDHLLVEGLTLPLK
jgi:20S proteasome alpha/beta subunit